MSGVRRVVRVGGRGSSMVRRPRMFTDFSRVRVWESCACAGRGANVSKNVHFLFSPGVISKGDNFFAKGAGGEIPTVLGRRRGRPLLVGMWG